MLPLHPCVLLKHCNLGLILSMMQSTVFSFYGQFLSYYIPSCALINQHNTRIFVEFGNHWKKKQQMRILKMGSCVWPTENSGAVLGFLSSFMQKVAHYVFFAEKLQCWSLFDGLMHCTSFSILLCG